MADDDKTSAEAADAAESPAGGKAAGEAAAPPAEAAAATPAPGGEELAAMKDRVLRTLAEMENLRQRTAREVADARQYAVTNFAREVLAVGDNLRRAIEAVPTELRKGDDKTLAALIEGVEVTERVLAQALAKFGIRPVDAKGQKFDPGVHQSIMEVETAEVAPGNVAQEIQAGYVIGERVLRPSLVAVAKKPGKAAAKPNGDTASEDRPAEPAPDATTSAEEAKTKSASGGAG